MGLGGWQWLSIPWGVANSRRGNEPIKNIVFNRSVCHRPGI